MKISKITLKESEIREVEGGEYEQHFYNPKNYPAFLTNYSLKQGKERGYIKTSLFGELADLTKVMGSTKIVQNQNDENETEVEEEAELDIEAINSLGEFDEEQAHKVIYLALTGANPNFEHSYEEFLKRFHYGLEESLEIYAELLSNLVSSNPNQFANEFKKATNKDKKK